MALRNNLKLFADSNCTLPLKESNLLTLINQGRSPRL
nr:MAG TPA: hypothetical protein [Caudoviricetes sp.]